jgi:hypothetical protein
LAEQSNQRTLSSFADQSNLWPVPFRLFAPLGTIYLTTYLVILLLLAGRRAL